MDSLRGSSVRIGTMQRSSGWPPRKDDMHKSRSANTFMLRANYMFVVLLCFSTSK